MFINLIIIIYMWVSVCVYEYMYNGHTVDLYVWGPKISVKDLNCWTINADDLSIAVKGCIRSPTFLEWADGWKLCSNGSQILTNNIPWVLNSKISFIQVVILKLQSPICCSRFLASARNETLPDASRICTQLTIFACVDIYTSTKIKLHIYL